MSDGLPEKSKGDVLHLLSRMALSGVPGIGGSALELFNYIIQPSLERRRDKFLGEILERIKKLESSGCLKIEDLLNNEEFISILLRASRVALQNHEREKIKTLQNAVLNTALGQSIEDSKRDLFLSFIEGFTVPHFQALNRIGYAMSTNVGSIGVAVLPSLRGEEEFAEAVIDDLHTKRLLSVDRKELTKTFTTIQLSKLGSDFLKFISDPPEIKK